MASLDVLFKDILTPAKLKWTSLGPKLVHVLVFIRKSSISCVQSHDQLSWSDCVGKHAGVAVCILLGLYPWAHLLKAAADVTFVWFHVDWNLSTNADWSWCHQQSVLSHPWIHDRQKKWITSSYDFFFNSSVWKVTTGDCFLVKTARRTVRDVVLCMPKHRRISAVVANLCTHTTLKKWASIQQWYNNAFWAYLVSALEKRVWWRRPEVPARRQHSFDFFF